LTLMTFFFLSLDSCTQELQGVGFNFIFIWFFLTSLCFLFNHW
jgi:hypothetical protein